MVEYRNAKGLAFELDGEFPVYDEDGNNVIGHTREGDIVVITLEEQEGDNIYAEATIATGEFAGYQGLVLNLEDIKRCIHIGWPRGEGVYLRDIPLTVC